MKSRLQWHMTLQSSNSERMMLKPGWRPTIPSATMKKGCCILKRSASPALATFNPFTPNVPDACILHVIARLLYCAHSQILVIQELLVKRWVATNNTQVRRLHCMKLYSDGTSAPHHVTRCCPDDPAACQQLSGELVSSLLLLQDLCHTIHFASTTLHGNSLGMAALHIAALHELLPNVHGWYRFDQGCCRNMGSTGWFRAGAALYMCRASTALCMSGIGE